MPKNYLAFGDPTRAETVAYLAKRGRLGRKPPYDAMSPARECVTEQILSEIGRTLPLVIAKSKLVRLPSKGAPDVRFMSRMFLRRGEEVLIHGVEIAAAFLGSQQRELHEVFRLEDPIEERKFFNVATMIEVLRFFGRNPIERNALVDAFGRMLMFDALVGAQDRHPENWGVIESVVDPSAPRRFAPLYDTARGLFWNSPDTQLPNHSIEKYAERAHPVFGCTESDSGKDVNHFRLAEYVLYEADPVARASAQQVLRAYSPGLIRRLLKRRYSRIISPLRIAYIMDLLKVRHARLMAILHNVHGRASSQ
ncbi:MAG: HipA domain-containing protein [Myxococcota bacterium]|nr:HipA domain-containing protein [Myxococcota bacterium]